MHRNKGIVIELTALLDVIMIMLFWVMMNTSETAGKARQEAEQAQQQIQTAQSEADKAKEEAQRQIEEEKEKARQLNERAFANQQALDDYEKGLGVTINIRFEDESDRIYISRNEQPQGDFPVSGTQIAQRLEEIFKEMGLSADDPVLCTVVYDGDTVLNKDYDKTAQAMEELQNTYKYLYCTFINTTK